MNAEDPILQKRGRASSATAILLSLAISASLLAWLPAPARWGRAHRLVSLPDTDAHRVFEALISGFVTLLPIGEIAQRPDLLAAGLILAIVAAASWAVHGLLRGMGRWLAAVSVSPLVTVSLGRWLSTRASAQDVADPVEPLLALLLTLGSVFVTGLVLRSLVTHRRLIPRSLSAATTVAGLICLISPRTGLPFALLLVATAGLVALRPGSDTRTEVLESLRALAWGAILPALSAGVIAGLGGRFPRWDVASLQVHLPRLERLEGLEPMLPAYMGLALLVLLVIPLRWRGGALAAVLGAGALMLSDGQGPLAPTPAILTLLLAAATGWIWLAGSVGPRRLRVRASLSATAAGLLLGISLAPSLAESPPTSRPLAEQRPTNSALAIYEKGLVAPGDVWLIHQRWLLDAMQARRALEGWRPDVQIRDAWELEEPELLSAAFEWSEAGRRVLLDSYDAGGRWSPGWILDSGPLFWFVGQLDPEDQDFTDLSQYEADHFELPPLERARRAIIAIERARFRRAVDASPQALLALPMSPERKRGLSTRLQLARSVRPSPGLGSELPAGLAPIFAAPDAALTAEAGDLLFANGEHARAAELLVEAAEAGYRPALGALARWQLRAGEDRSARRTLAALARDRELRDEALGMVRWLIERERLDDATWMLDVLGRPVEGTHSHEAALRLLLLDAQSATPAPRPAPPLPDTLTRR